MFRGIRLVTDKETIDTLERKLKRQEQENYDLRNQLENKESIFQKHIDSLKKEIQDLRVANEKNGRLALKHKIEEIDRVKQCERRAWSELHITQSAIQNLANQNEFLKKELSQFTKLFSLRHFKAFQAKIGSRSNRTLVSDYPNLKNGNSLQSNSEFKRR